VTIRVFSACEPAETKNPDTFSNEILIVNLLLAGERHQPRSLSFAAPEEITNWRVLPPRENWRPPRGHQAQPRHSHHDMRRRSSFAFRNAPDSAALLQPSLRGSLRIGARATPKSFRASPCYRCTVPPRTPRPAFPRQANLVQAPPAMHTNARSTRHSASVAAASSITSSEKRPVLAMPPRWIRQWPSKLKRFSAHLVARGSRYAGGRCAACANQIQFQISPIACRTFRTEGRSHSQRFQQSAEPLRELAHGCRVWLRGVRRRRDNRRAVGKLNVFAPSPPVRKCPPCFAGRARPPQIRVWHVGRITRRKSCQFLHSTARRLSPRAPHDIRRPYAPESSLPSPLPLRAFQYVPGLHSLISAMSSAFHHKVAPAPRSARVFSINVRAIFSVLALFSPSG